MDDWVLATLGRLPQALMKPAISGSDLSHATIPSQRGTFIGCEDLVKLPKCR